MVKVERWKNAATHNLPLHRQLAKKQIVAALRNPVAHRNRVNLWVLAAGILDATRYLNLSVMHIQTDLHDEFDGNRAERSQYFELRGFLEDYYADAFARFRDFYSVPTDNFADVELIKTLLHELVFNRPNYAEVTDPFVLLSAAAHESIYQTGIRKRVDTGALKRIKPAA